MRHLVLASWSLFALVLVGCGSTEAARALDDQEREHSAMELGAFSVSLTVKDIAASRSFYEALGFEQKGGDQSQNWVVLSNGTSNLGLFQGMFDNNILTFNPGWNQSGEPVAEFTDVREIQRSLKEKGIALVTETDEAGEGPASVVLLDPDGNMILLDQHVDRPKGAR
jgi:catechol 2,3-dioxygenase-like lactoylglutathione lyase family enzyme